MAADIKPLEAETAVVGSILIDSACLRAVREILRPEDMALAINQEIYRAALQLDRQGRRIDPITIRDEAAKHGTEISNEYLLTLMQQTPTAANAAEYSRITRRNSLRRSITGLAEEAKERATTESEEPAAILADLRRGAEELSQEGVDKVLLSPEDLMMRFYTHRDQVDSGKVAAYVPTGYRDLDRMLGGGMLASGMYVLAARPGKGKTTLAINIADRVAKQLGPVLFVSLEMDDEQISAKRLARESGIPSNRLLMDKLSDEEYARMQEAVDKVMGLPVHINSRPTATVEQIEDMACRIKDLKLIVIDYLGKISPGSRGQRMERYDYITEISGAIKDMARRHKVPILLLAQLNREVEKRRTEQPQLSDLRDSGAVEQDADGVIFLWRDKYFGEENQKDRWGPEQTHVELAKNRHGAVGECQLAFALATSKVTAMSNEPRDGYRKDMQMEQQELPWEGEYQHLGEQLPD